MNTSSIVITVIAASVAPATSAQSSILVHPTTHWGWAEQLTFDLLEAAQAQENANQQQPFAENRPQIMPAATFAAVSIHTGHYTNVLVETRLDDLLQPEITFLDTAKSKTPQSAISTASDTPFLAKLFTQ